MKKRYKFTENGVVKYRNIETSEQEQAFFSKYGKFNPTIITEQDTDLLLGKSADPSFKAPTLMGNQVDSAESADGESNSSTETIQPQNTSENINTESQSESSSSELQFGNEYEETKINSLDQAVTALRTDASEKYIKLLSKYKTNDQTYDDFIESIKPVSNFGKVAGDNLVVETGPFETKTYEQRISGWLGGSLDKIGINRSLSSNKYTSSLSYGSIPDPALYNVSEEESLKYYELKFLHDSMVNSKKYTERTLADDDGANPYEVDMTPGGVINNDQLNEIEKEVQNNQDLVLMRDGETGVLTDFSQSDLVDVANETIQQNLNDAYSRVATDYNNEFQEIVKNINPEIETQITKEYNALFKEAEELIQPEINSIKIQIESTRPSFEEFKLNFENEYANPTEFQINQANLSWEKINKEWEQQANKKLNAQIQALYDTATDGIQYDAQDAYSNLIDNHPDVIQLKKDYTNKTIEDGDWYNNALNEAIKNQYNYDNWNSAIGISSLNDIAKRLDDAGITSLGFHEKRLLIENELLQEMKVNRDFFNNLTPEELEDYKMEYYSYFLQKLNTKRSVDDFGNVTVAQSQFFFSDSVDDIKDIIEKEYMPTESVLKDASGKDIYIRLVGERTPKYLKILHTVASERALNTEQRELELAQKRNATDEEIQNIKNKYIVWHNHRDNNTIMSEAEIKRLATNGGQGYVTKNGIMSGRYFGGDAPTNLGGWIRMEHIAAQKYNNGPGGDYEATLNLIASIQSNPSEEQLEQMSHMWHGFFGGDVEEAIPFKGSLDAISRLSNIMWASKAENKTQAQKMLLASSSMKDQSDKLLDSYSTRTYRWARGIRKTLPWIGEFVATGPAYRAFSASLKIGLKTALKKSLKSRIKISAAGNFIKPKTITSASSKLFSGTGFKIADKSIDIFALIASAGVHTAVNPLRVGEEFIPRMTNEHIWAFSVGGEAEELMAGFDAYTYSDEEGKELGLKNANESFGEAFIRAFGMTYSEMFSERLGFLIPGLGKAGVSSFQKTLKITDGAIEDFMKRLTMSYYLRNLGVKGVANQLKSISRATGWHGALGEFSEEMFNIPMSNWADGNPNVLQGMYKYDKLGRRQGLDVRNLLDIAASVGTMSMAFNTFGVAANNLSGSGTKVHIVDGVYYKNRKDAETRLNYLIKQGRLDSNTDIEIRYDYGAFDSITNMVNEANGKKKGIGLVKDKGGNIIGIKANKNITLENGTQVKKGEEYMFKVKQGDVVGPLNKNINPNQTIKNPASTPLSQAWNEITEATKNQIKTNSPKQRHLVTATEVEISDRMSTDELKQVEDLTSKLNEKSSLLNSIEAGKSKTKEKEKIQVKAEVRSIKHQINNIKKKYSDQIIKEKQTKKYRDTISSLKKISENKQFQGAGAFNIVSEDINGDNITGLTVENEAMRVLGYVKNQNGDIQNRDGKVLTPMEVNTLNAQLAEMKQSHGFFIPGKDLNGNNITEDGKPALVLNEEMAVNEGGSNVASHEFFHHYLSWVLSTNPELKLALGIVFDNHIKKIDPEMVRNGRFRQRLNAYNNKPLSERSEEAMAIFLDSLADGSMAYNESIMQKIGSIIRRIARRFGYEIKLENGKDVYNWLKDFQSSVERGDISPGLKNSLKIENIGGQVKEIAESKEVKDQIKAEDSFKELMVMLQQESKTSGILMSKTGVPQLNEQQQKDNKNFFDKFVQNENGTNKYENQEEFLADKDNIDKIKIALKGNDSPLYNIKILESMRGGIANIPPAELNDFIADVKQRIVDKFTNEYKYDAIKPTVSNIEGKVSFVEDNKGNVKSINVTSPDGKVENYKIGKSRNIIVNNGDNVKIDQPLTEAASLFGWLTGTAGGMGQSIIFRAKGDVMIKYNKKIKTTSLDKQIGEGGTLGDILPGQTDKRTDTFMEEDISIGARKAEKQKQAETSKEKDPAKRVLKSQGVAIEDEFNFDNKTKVAISSNVKDQNYSVDGKNIKEIKEDILAQSKKVNTAKNVEATGPLVESIKSISQNVFNIPYKSILAQPYNMPKVTQGIPARQKIADLAKKIGAQRLLSLIHLEAQFYEGPNAGKATGVYRGLLKAYYVKGMRLPNKPGWAKKRKMTDAQILAPIGINPDFTLMPQSKFEYDGVVKGIVVHTAIIATLQQAKVQQIKNTMSKLPNIDATEAYSEIKSKINSVSAGVVPSILFSKIDMSERAIEVYQLKETEVLASMVSSILDLSETKSIKNYLLDIFEDEIKAKDITSKELGSVASKIKTWFDEYNQIDNKHKSFEVETSLESFVFDKTTDALFGDSKVDSFLSSMFSEGNKGKTAGALMTDIKRVSKARNSIKSWVENELAGGKKPKELLSVLLNYAEGMYANSARIGDGRWLTNIMTGDIYMDPNWEDSKEGAYDGNKWARDNKLAFPGNLKLGKNGKPKVKVNRGQVFLNSKDFLNVLSNIPELGLKDKNGNTLSRQEIKKKYNIEVSKFEESSSAAMKDKDYIGRLAQAKTNRDFVMSLTGFYMNKIKPKKGKASLQYEDLAILARMFGSGMKSPMRRAANAAWIAEGVYKVPENRRGKDLEYEHMIPAQAMILEMFKTYINKGKLPDNFWDNYTVQIIPASMNDVLKNNGMQYRMHMNYKHGDPSYLRNYNMHTFGNKGLVPIVSMNPKDKGNTTETIIKEFVNVNNAILNNKLTQKDLSRYGRTFRLQTLNVKNLMYSKSVGMSTFDFDETVGISENFIIATKDGVTKKISSDQWPFVGDNMIEDGWKMDFSDFNKVTKGKPGPLFQKMKNQIAKYGPDNVFILTARGPGSQVAIHEWLKQNGIDIPLANVTGLGQSSGEAKAEWMLEKFKEGYNDMYFVDDAMPNVKAVKDLLEQLDIKSKVVQARIKFSKTAGGQFNEIISENKNIDPSKYFSAAEARKRGIDSNKFNFFVPASAEDFKGLMYRFLGKGKKGNKDMEFFKQHLFTPFAKGYVSWNDYKQTMSNEYTSLKKKAPSVKLREKVKGTSFTNDTAIRVYLWDKAGFDIPGLASNTKDKLVSHVTNNPALVSYAESLSRITRLPNGYLEPSENWVVETIATDLANTVNKVGRKQFLNEWIENKNEIFSKENLNKIEALYGGDFRNELEQMLFRMENGSNRAAGQDKNVNKMLNWINGSVGAVMFFNMRSATLQTISMVNFLNFEDNNIFKAAAAFANQPQYWKDFAFILNSPMLKQRRAGLQIDVSASELSKAFAEGNNKPQAVINYLLEIGFTPTKMADSFAIAMGGSTYYRNRVNRYLSEGMTKPQAEKQAFEDFQEIAEETQQSSRPDLISNQQAGPLGRLILAWQNTPMQMTRLTKKAMSDLVNGRGDWKSNVSRIIYYGVVQNIIFGTLQTGLAFIMFGDDDEKEKSLQKMVLNGALDTLLRGTGIYGAAVSTIKNTYLEFKNQEEKGYGKRQDWKVLQQLISLSPPLGTKTRKIMNAYKTHQYNKGVGEQLGFRIENPSFDIATNLIEAGTNLPIARLLHKVNNLEEAITGNHETWKRIAIGMGWSMWSVGVRDEELEEAKVKAREKRKLDKKKINDAKKEIDKKEKENKEKEEQKAKEKENKEKGIKTIRCSGKNSSGKQCGLTTETDKKTWKCFHHRTFVEGSDADGDGIKEYQCTGTTSSGKRCKNKGEYTGKTKRCYAHK